MKIVIVTGLSGAGKTKAADWFEDQGYYCIDNMPPQLVKNFLELSLLDTGKIEKLALIADIRGGQFFEELEKIIDELRGMEGVESSVLYIEASVSTIVKRYNETRRTHPLTVGKANADVIEEEISMLTGLRKKADYIVDTTGMKGADFEHELARIFLGNESKSIFNINITSFGYKYGIPNESDIVVDMRFIPNPFYIEELKAQNGNDEPVFDYVMQFDITKSFIENFHGMINDMITGYIKEGKYHLNIGIGCTGGQHRSVAIANEMAKWFRRDGRRVTLTHRDVDLGSKRR